MKLVCGLCYVAATFAAAGFGINSDALENITMASFAAIGFLAFAIGQFLMIKVSLSKRKAIQSVLGEEEAPEIQVLLTHVVSEGVGIYGAIMTHVIINSCVVALILYRAFCT